MRQRWGWADLCRTCSRGASTESTSTTLGLIVEPSVWRPPIAARLTEITIPGQHGNIMPGLPVFDAPLINLSIWRAWGSDAP